MKKWLLLLFFLVVLTGCRIPLTETHVEIEWVDFIKWNGKEYNGIYSGILADEQLLGDVLGEVKYRVADNVKDPGYKIKDGDAAFHEKGTKIYSIKNNAHLIAVKSNHSIHGYQVYFSRDDMEYIWHYKDMPNEQVSKVEIYEAYTSEGTKLINELNKMEDINKLLDFLKESKEDPQFQPDTIEKDPTYYEAVFYADGPVAYKYNIQFDGSTYYWYPWDTAILSDEIGLILQNTIE